MTAAPHLLYIAFWYPPSRASGVYRALATTRAFADSGWKVTVVTTTTEFLMKEIGSVDESLLASIPDGVDLVRVPFTLDPEVDLREVGWFQGNFPIARQVARAGMGGLVDSLSARFGSPRPRVREPYSTWIEPVVGAALRLRSPFQHILATGNPFSSFEAAREISEATGFPYSVDFRDPWTIDVFTGGRAALPAGTEAAERRIIEQAAACVHVNDAIADAYRAKYPEFAAKQSVVVNGYDPDSVAIVPPEYSGGPLRLGILGTVNDRWPLGPIFDAWQEVRPALPEGSELVLAGHLGYFAKSAELIEKRLPAKSGGFRFVGPKTKSQVAAYYGSLDVVVVPVPGSQMVTSGKVFEAMGLGIPFVCVQERGGDARRVASSHPFSFAADPESASVAKAMLAAVEARQAQTSGQIREARDSTRSFARDVTMKAMVEVIGGRPGTE